MLYGKDFILVVNTYAHVGGGKERYAFLVFQQKLLGGWVLILTLKVLALNTFYDSTPGKLLCQPIGCLSTQPKQLEDCFLFVGLFTLSMDGCLPADSNTSHCCCHLWSGVSVDSSKRVDSRGISEAQHSHKDVNEGIYNQSPVHVDIISACGCIFEKKRPCSGTVLCLWEACGLSLW